MRVKARKHLRNEGSRRFKSAPLRQRVTTNRYPVVASFRGSKPTMRTPHRHRREGVRRGRRLPLSARFLTLHTAALALVARPLPPFPIRGKHANMPGAFLYPQAQAVDSICSAISSGWTW